jgi:acyl-CoA dehydrogenase
MPFPQTDEQRELVDTVHKLLAEIADPIPPSWDDRGAGLNRSVWGSLASLGLLGLGVAEDLGGSGGGLRELCLVAAEIGGVCARVPFVGTAAVLAAGMPDVGPIVDGSLIAVPAWETHPALPSRRSAALTLSGKTVDGSVQAVAFGMDADALLAYAGDTAVVVDLTQTGVRRHSVPAFDVTEPVAALTLHAADAIVLEPRPSLPWVRTVVAAELIGTARRALDGAVQYAKERHQFGRAIGSFQGIKHMLADRYVQLEAAHLLVDAAITAVDEGRSGRARCGHRGRPGRCRRRPANTRRDRLHLGAPVTRVPQARPGPAFAVRVARPTARRSCRPHPRTASVNKRRAGVPVRLIGGADVTGELDAKRAIDQGARVATVL